jgi:glycyl-tRNA synthetase beta chain
MMTDFLLELRSEEIPARMQDKARDDLARLFAAELAKAGLVAGSIETFATPRRLALIVHDLPLETEAVSEETKGPKVGAPPQAMEGFLRKTGVTQGQLVERDGAYFAVIEKPGRKTADVLAEAIPAIIRAFPWPKSQRWGAASASTESLRWVRPLQGIVALLGDDVVACEVDGIVSGAATMGHRFHHSGEITIGNAADYALKLRAAHVIVDQDERRAVIRAGAEKAASDAGLILVPDEGLVNENSGLTEWPVPMLGRFDRSFLDVPPEVIQLTARVNQKYFVCQSPSPLKGRGGSSAAAEGEGTNTGLPLSPTLSPEGEREITNAFVCTANIVANDAGVAIVAGNEKVLAARLSDAKFFWEADLKIPLEKQAEKLSNIVFHEKLGTVADKVERVAKLARWLVESGVIKPSPLQGRGLGEGAVNNSPTSTDSPLSPALSPEGERELLADQATRAARLCKADLVTGMVGEFPELQGIMGGYYARAQGEDDAVADAIRDHYKPVGQGDDVPTAPVTVALSLADKLDTIAGFFLFGLKPTGSKDPFALRRAAVGILALIVDNKFRLSLDKFCFASMIDTYRLSRGEESKRLAPHPEFQTERNEVKDFFADRLKVQQREAGVRHDLIDAVFALGGEDDLVRLLARVKALQAFVITDEGINLLAGYKRAANILKSSGAGDNKDRVIPAKAGIQLPHAQLETNGQAMDSRLRGNDEEGVGDGVSDVEVNLYNALNAAEPLASTAIEAENFEAAMTALASLRAPIDAFFDGVMVNDPDPDKRAFRLGLLTRFRDAVHKVADFSKIEG